MLQPSFCCRIGSCIILKLFLIWVLGNSASGDEAYPVWKGWVIAASLGCTGYLLTLLHHQIFWCALPQYSPQFSRPEHCILQEGLSRKRVDDSGLGCMGCFVSM